MTRKSFFSLIAAALGIRSGYSRPVEFDATSPDESFVKVAAISPIKGVVPSMPIRITTGTSTEMIEAKSVIFTGNQAKVELLSGLVIERHRTAVSILPGRMRTGIPDMERPHV